MAFQSVIGTQIGFGVVGELAFEGPLVAQPALLRSADAANNVIGRAFTVVSGATGSWAVGSAGAADPKTLVAAAGGAGQFAGLLVNPKVYALLGTLADGPFGAVMTLPNETLAELAKEGQFVISLSAPCAVGDILWYLTTTGALVTSAPGAAKPANTGPMPIGKIERFPITDGGGGLTVALLIHEIQPAA